MLPLPGRNKKNPEPIIFEISENGFAHVGESESSKSMSAALKTAGGSAAAPAVAVGLVVAVIDQSREPSCELVSLQEKGLGARGETPRCTEIGDAPDWQGATREQIGTFVTAEQRRQADAAPIECSGAVTTGS